jgi:hypothetical protein
MRTSAYRALQWALMSLISAFLFVQFFHLNGWLFSALEHVHGVNWVFLPAGLRVLLVLILGTPGAMGIMMANWWLERDALSSETALPILLTSLVSGFGPWLIRRGMLWKQLLDDRLMHLTSRRLLQFVLAYAALNAFGHQLVWWFLSHHNALPWVDLWPMFVGDTLGALIFLYSFKPVLAWWRQRALPAYE